MHSGLLFACVHGTGLSTRESVRKPSQKNEEEKVHNSNGRSIVKFRKFKCHTVNVGYEQVRGMAGTTLGHDINEIKIGKGIDDPDNEAEKDRGFKQREGNAAKPLPGTGTVNGC
jgi:hypothetical protein